MSLKDEMDESVLAGLKMGVSILTKHILNSKDQKQTPALLKKVESWTAQKRKMESSIKRFEYEQKNKNS